jgi:hypothetical protein
MFYPGFDVDVVKPPAIKARFALAGLLAAIVLLTAGAATSAAATLGVTTGGNDTGDCVDSPCLTIQYAIGEAADGDTITVGAGTYSEDVVVDKGVTLQGAQAGTDARERTGAETVVQAAPTGTGNAPTFSVRADDVTIDGFTITQDEARTNGGMGILVPTNLSTQNLTVINNVITDNQYGMAGFTPQPTANITGLRVRRNLFADNNRDTLGSPTTTALYMPGRIGDDVQITDNAFENTFAAGGDGAAVNIGGRSGDLLNDVVVTGNTSDNDQSFLVLTSATNATVEDNRVTNQTGTSVFIGGGTGEVTIAGNEITDGSNAGIRVTDLLGATAPSDIGISGNTITGMATYGVVLAGVAADPGDMSGVTINDNVIHDNTDGIGTEGTPSLTGTAINGNSIVGNETGIGNGTSTELDAENNWWGCNGTPGAEGCDTATGPLDTSPHLELDVTVSPDALAPGGTATVTASFTRNSAGQPVTVPALNGRTVEFVAEGGSVNPESAVLAAGEASATWTAGDAPGTGVAGAIFDNASEVAAIEITGTAPAVTDPVLSGSGQVGEALVCTPGTATGNPAPDVETVLLADGAPIAGQSGLSYTPVESDVGKAITCRTTATSAAGSAEASSRAITVTAVPVPPDPPKPPVVKPVKRKVTVPNNGKVVVATIRCPDGTCRIKAPKRVKVKIGKRTYVATVKVQKRVVEGKSGKVRIVLPKKARKAIKGRSGRAKLKITVTSTDGTRRTVNQTVKLKGRKR